MNLMTRNLTTENSRYEMPIFSLIPLFITVLIKPLADAFYETNAVKYGYMALLIFSVFFAYVGRSITTYSNHQVRNDVSQIPKISALLTIYTAYLIGLLFAYNGSLQDIFKIISPFLFYILVASVSGRWVVLAIALSGGLTIAINALLLPTDFGWVYWGAVKTFKGYFYFKTDLAYAICFSILFVAIWFRFKFTALMLGMLLLATVQIVFANSRLNYVIFFTVLLYLVAKNGRSVGSLLLYSSAVAVLSIAAVYLFDQTKLLGFDITNEKAFTQGRSVIWDVAVTQGLASYSIAEWVLGRGLFADILIYAQSITTGEAHNAHNEWLHLLLTQGLLGCGLYIALWVLLVKTSVSSQTRWFSGTATLALSMVILQSFTSVISLFATKTWPLAMVFLMLRELRLEPAATKRYQ